MVISVRQQVQLKIDLPQGRMVTVRQVLRMARLIRTTITVINIKLTRETLQIGHILAETAVQRMARLQLVVQPIRPIQVMERIIRVHEEQQPVVIVRPIQRRKGQQPVVIVPTILEQGRRVVAEVRTILVDQEPQGLPVLDLQDQVVVHDADN